MHATLALRLAMSIFVLVAGPFFAPAAATWTVTSLADAGPGTLRAAIETANAVPGADKIILSVAGEISLLEPLPEVVDALTLAAGGRVTLVGGEFVEDPRAMLRIRPGVTVSIRGMNFTGAFNGAIENRGSLSVQDCSFQNNLALYGGAIYNTGWLSLKRATFSGNESDESGGAIYSSGTLLLQAVVFDDNLSHYNAGALHSTGRLEGQDVTFTHNEAYEDEAGALLLSGTARLTRVTFENNNVHNGGGAIWNNGSLILEQVNFQNNFAKWGGAIFNWIRADLTIIGGTLANNGAGHHGGAIDNAGVMNLTNVTISGNFAYDFGGGINNEGKALLSRVIMENNQGGFGGAIYNGNELKLENSFLGGNQTPGEGGGLANDHGTALIHNTTFSGNTADLQGGAISNTGSLDLNFVTLAHNSSPAGGAIFNSGPDAIKATAVIAAYSPAGGNCSGAFDPGLANLSDDATCSGFDVADPRLAPLATVSGTRLHSLRLGSPAIDRLPPGACGVSVDQRFVPRPQGPACDSGAVEVVKP